MDPEKSEMGSTYVCLLYCLPNEYIHGDNKVTSATEIF